MDGKSKILLKRAKKLGYKVIRGKTKITTVEDLLGILNLKTFPIGSGVSLNFSLLPQKVKHAILFNDKSDLIPNVIIDARSKFEQKQIKDAPVLLDEFNVEDRTIRDVAIGLLIKKHTKGKSNV
jgi:hypothetical protein